MKYQFTIEPIKFETIEELPNVWTDQSYRQLLDIMEYGDTSDLSPQDLKEMFLLSLSDREPDEAAKIILEHIFGDRLNKGQIANISHEMLDEKVWEEHAELSIHEELFNAGQILYSAYNGKFPHPEAIRFKLKVVAREKKALGLLGESTESTLIRLLVQGMPENTVMHRLFDKQLKGVDFTEAKDIIWQYRTEKAGENALLFEIISSYYWLHDLKYVDNFNASLETDETL